MTHHLFCKHDTTPFSEYKNYKGNPELQTKEAKIKKKKEKILQREQSMTDEQKKLEEKKKNQRIG